MARGIAEKASITYLMFIKFSFSLKIRKEICEKRKSYSSDEEVCSRDENHLEIKLFLSQIFFSGKGK